MRNNHAGERLSKREFLLFFEACRWYSQYRDCNPEVGFPPTNASLVDDICKILSFDILREDKVRVIDLLQALKEQQSRQAPENTTDRAAQGPSVRS